MGSADILKGVGLRRANALAVNLDVGDSIALIRSDGEGLISALTDADIAGGRNGAASPGSCLDGVVAVAASAATAASAFIAACAAIAFIAACAAIAQNRQRVGLAPILTTMSVVPLLGMATVALPPVDRACPLMFTGSPFPDTAVTSVDVAPLSFCSV